MINAPVFNDMQDEIDRLTKELEEAKERIQRQHEELRRVAEYAQCMAEPVEYDDDTVFLKRIKGTHAFVYQSAEAVERELNLYKQNYPVKQLSDRVRELEAKLARYEGGTIDGRITMRRGLWEIRLFSGLNRDLIGQKVRVLVMKEEKK